MKKSLISLILIGGLASLLVLLTYAFSSKQSKDMINSHPSILPSSTPSPTPLPKQKILSNNYHIFQSFNNCGPASLSMLLSYYGIQETQEKLGNDLRPYQNPQGNNDDKSVTLSELATKAHEYDVLSYHRPNGNIQLVKQFIALGFPVLTRTWLKADEDIGHYRVIKGYDDALQQLIQDDSLQGKNLWYSYDDFMNLWKKFNYEYVVLVPKEKKAFVENIIGKNTDEKVAWQNALKAAENDLINNPNDIYTRFNISVAAYYAGDFKKSVEAFETVENQLPWRTLWYQNEPLLSYYELGNDEKVLSLTERILHNQNQAYAELYLLRGSIYKRQGNKHAAQQEYEKAIFYNVSLKEATKALSQL